MKLATIQKVLAVEPIEGADKIEKIQVLGWWIVSKKCEYKAGDLACYIQIDTVVPEKPEFEFLRERNFRVRTIKLKKQISQGLVIPLPKQGLKEGDDVTELIGVKKYEKPDNNPLEKYEKPRVPKTFWKKYVYLFKYNILYKLFPNLRPKLRSSFPTNLVSITDEERIQNIPQTLEKYKGEEFMASYKLDGSSITIIHNKVLGKSKYRICSRRFELHDKKNDWYRVFEKTNFSKHVDALVNHFKTNDIIVQGEAIGKFNGNHHNLKDDEIRLFNIYVDGKRLKPLEFREVVEGLSIPHCPILGVKALNFTMEEILKYVQIPDILNPKVPVEGLVFRNIKDGTSFKVINNEFLIKKGE